MPIAPFRLVEKTNPDGSKSIGIDIREKKRHVGGFWLVDPDKIPVTLAGGGRTTLHFTVDSRGHFDWAYIVGISTGRYSIEFTDGGRNKLLQNAPVMNELIVGESFRPLMLAKPYFVDVGNSQREITCVIRDLSGTTNTIWLSLYGRRFYHKEMPPEMALEVSREAIERGEDYNYVLVPNETTVDGDLAVVASGGSVTLTFEADDDANIEIQKIVGSKEFGDNFDQVMIRERDTNRGIVSAPAGRQLVAASSIKTNAGFPVYLPDSYLLERKKQLILTAHNTGNDPAKPFIALIGRRYQYRTG